MTKKGIIFLLAVFLFSCKTTDLKKTATTNTKPTIFIIGDSTVRNGSGKGSDKLWGWGSFLYMYFDTTKVTIKNKAIGGRSSRTFLTEGRWDEIMKELKEGDYVLMQFGHNDGGPMATGRARASIKGNTNDTVEVTLESTGKKEIVHSYGWYMRKYISEAKSKGATAYVFSPVPRNIWNDGKIGRASKDYGKWAKEAAQQAGAIFVDLNDIIALRYEKLGEEKVRSEFFEEDHTHTNKTGALINVQAVIDGVKGTDKCELCKYMIEPK